MTEDLPVTAHCPVCGDGLEGKLTPCPRCETPHHEECYKYNDGCGIYACNIVTSLVEHASFSLENELKGFKAYEPTTSATSMNRALFYTKKLINLSVKMGYYVLEAPFTGGRFASTLERAAKDKGLTIHNRWIYQGITWVGATVPFTVLINVLTLGTLGQLGAMYALGMYATGIVYEEYHHGQSKELREHPGKMLDFLSEITIPTKRINHA